MTPVLIHRAVLDAIIAHALETRPAECCGLLVGSDGEIVEAVRSPNLSADPNRYELDPAVHIQARRQARSRGLGVVGFYHSHPHSPAVPSPSDIAEAQYRDELYLIVDAREEHVHARVYRLAGVSFEEVALAVY